MEWVRARRVVMVLACLVYALGSPMAWAQWMDTNPAGQAASHADLDGAPCHDAPAAGESSAPDSMPCCDDGSCTCAAPALSVYLSPGAPARLRTPFIAPFDTSTMPARPLDDTLKPPIR